MRPVFGPELSVRRFVPAEGNGDCLTRCLEVIPTVSPRRRGTLTTQESTVKRISSLIALALVALAVLAVVAVAGNRGDRYGGHGKATDSATPVFRLVLDPRQEVPPVDLRAFAKGNVTFDLTRDDSGRIKDGEVVFYFNYRFPEAVELVGLHIHQAPKGANGPVVVDSGLTPFTDADGRGNVTFVVTGVDPALLQSILDNPRGYYVNLHTSEFPDGAVRDQLRYPKRF